MSVKTKLKGMKVPYERLQKLYDSLADFANEDGYCVCSITKVFQVLEIREKESREKLLRWLIGAGCLVAHPSRQYTTGVPVVFYKLGEKVLTKEYYDSIHPPVK